MSKKPQKAVRDKIYIYVLENRECIIIESLYNLSKKICI